MPLQRVAIILVMLLVVVASCFQPGRAVNAQPSTPTPNPGTGCYLFTDLANWHHSPDGEIGIEFDIWAIIPPSGFATVPYWWGSGAYDYGFAGDWFQWTFRINNDQGVNAIANVETQAGSHNTGTSIGGGWSIINEHTTSISWAGTSGGGWSVDFCPPTGPTPTATGSPTVTQTPSITPTALGCVFVEAQDEGSYFEVPFVQTAPYRGWTAVIVEVQHDGDLVSAQAFDGEVAIYDFLLGLNQGVVVPQSPVDLRFRGSFGSFRVRFCPPTSTPTATMLPTPTNIPGHNCVTHLNVPIYNSVASGPRTNIPYYPFGGATFFVSYTFGPFAPPGQEQFYIGEPMLYINTRITGQSGYPAQFVFDYPDPWVQELSLGVLFPPSPVQWEFHVASDFLTIIGQTVTVRICTVAPTPTVTPTRTPTGTPTATGVPVTPSVTATLDPSVTPPTVTQTPYPSVTPLFIPTWTPVASPDATAVVVQLSDREPFYSFNRLTGAVTQVMTVVDANKNAPPCETIFQDVVVGPPFHIDSAGVGENFCWFIDQTTTIREWLRLVSVLFFGFVLVQYFVAHVRRMGDV